MIFRRRCLESDYVVHQAVETLKLVHTGDLPFDRTMRISTAEDNAKEKIAKRIPFQSPDDREARRTEPCGLGAPRTRPARPATMNPSRQLRARLSVRRRRKHGGSHRRALPEDGRIIPLSRKLRSISNKMHGAGGRPAPCGEASQEI